MTSLAAPLAVLALFGAQDPLEVQVLEPAGTFAADVRVEAHVGLVRYALAPDFDRWIAIEKHEGRTDDAGRVSFDAIPAGAQVTVFARSEGLAGIVDWDSGPCELVLQPTGAVRGKVSAKKVQLRYYKLEVVGLRGLDKKELELDSKGNYELEDVPVGDVELRVRLGGWLAGRGKAQVKSGKKAKASTVKITDEFQMGADPLVDVAKVRLVDESGEPMADISFTWNGPRMWGGMHTDDEGVVLMAGGNVAIGPPPFVLRLGRIGADQGQRYLGRLVNVKRGTANVEVVARLQKLRVALRRNGKFVRRFKLFAVTGGDSQRVWQGQSVDGDYELYVPPGPLKLFLGTLDGELHELDYELAVAEEATAHVIEL